MNGRNGFLFKTQKIMACKSTPLTLGDVKYVLSELIKEQSRGGKEEREWGGYGVIWV